MYKIGVIGDKESILGFKAAGFETFVANDPKEASRSIKQAVEYGFAVLYITENTAAGIPEVIEKYKSEPIPAIIPIPGKDGKCGAGMEAIHMAVEKAVGTDILSK